jgi:NDP-sugar pyrophosphorylase family protein
VKLDRMPLSAPTLQYDDNTQISAWEIEGSTVMDNVAIDCNKRIVDSLIGRQSRSESGHDILPSGLRFIVGESIICQL